MAMLSIWSRQDLGRLFSHCLKACLERPSSTASKRDGPVLLRTGVRSTTMVTYLSPQRVCRQTCSSTPSTVTPSNRFGSLKSRRLPSCQWPLFLTLFWPIKLTHPCSFNPQLFASVDSFHLPA